MPETLHFDCRPFAPADLTTIYAIEAECFDPPLRFSRNLLRSLCLDPRFDTWLALVDLLPAGFAIVGLSPEPSRDAAYLWTIEILPAFRRLGLGHRLMARVEDSVRQASLPALELHVAEDNLAAQQLYRTLGFQLTGNEPGFYGPGQHALLFRKKYP